MITTQIHFTSIQRQETYVTKNTNHKFCATNLSKIMLNAANTHETSTFDTRRTLEKQQEQTIFLKRMT